MLFRSLIETEPKRLSDAVLRGGNAGSAAAKLKLSRALRGDLDMAHRFVQRSQRSASHAPPIFRR